MPKNNKRNLIVSVILIILAIVLAVASYLSHKQVELLEHNAQQATINFDKLNREYNDLAKTNQSYIEKINNLETTIKKQQSDIQELNLNQQAATVKTDNDLLIDLKDDLANLKQQLSNANKDLLNSEQQIQELLLKQHSDKVDCSKLQDQLNQIISANKDLEAKNLELSNEIAKLKSYLNNIKAESPAINNNALPSQDKTDTNIKEVSPTYSPDNDAKTTPVKSSELPINKNDKSTSTASSNVIDNNSAQATTSASSTSTVSSETTLNNYAGQIIDISQHRNVFLLNIGKNNHLNPSVLFKVYRHDQDRSNYIGTVKIIRVLDNISLAKPISQILLTPANLASPASTCATSNFAIDDLLVNPFYNPDRPIKFYISKNLNINCCEILISELGGIIVDNIDSDTDYVVVNRLNNCSPSDLGLDYDLYKQAHNLSIPIITLNSIKQYICP